MHFSRMRNDRFSGHLVWGLYVWGVSAFGDVYLGICLPGGSN